MTFGTELRRALTPISRNISEGVRLIGSCAVFHCVLQYSRPYYVCTYISNSHSHSHQTAFRVLHCRYSYLFTYYKGQNLMVELTEGLISDKHRTRHDQRIGTCYVSGARVLFPR